MASTASTLSWNSCISTHNFGINTTGTAKLPEKRAQFVIVAQKKVKKIRKVVLNEDVEFVGKKGQLLTVRAGYLRNYLLPLGKAQIATPALLKEIEKEQERIEAEKLRVKEEAKQLARIFETFGAFKVKRKSATGKNFFGSVTVQDFIDIVKSQLQRDLDKKIVNLPEIRELGTYIVELKLHPEVTALVKLIVSAS